MSPEHVALADRFAALANGFCSVVDNAEKLDRTEFVIQTYRILPKLIDAALSLPDLAPTGGHQPSVELGMRRDEWQQLSCGLREKLGDWDSYRIIFDPTEDIESSCQGLSDDIADIYRDLKRGLVLRHLEPHRPQNAVWKWRSTFHHHWGYHAMGALRVIYFRLQHLDLQP